MPLAPEEQQRIYEGALKSRGCPAHVTTELQGFREGLRAGILAAAPFVSLDKSKKEGPPEKAPGPEPKEGG